MTVNNRFIPAKHVATMADQTETSRFRRKKKRRKPRPGDPIEMPLWLFYPLLLISVAGALFMFRRGDSVTAITIVITALAGWGGFKMGFGRIAASVVALVVAVAYAPAMGMQYQDAFAQKFGTSGLTNRFLCIAAIGVLISLVTTILITIIGNRIFLKRRKFRWANHFAGFAVGLAEGVVICYFLLGGLISLQMWQRGDDIRENAVAMAVDEWASRTRQSRLGPFIRDNNPFERFELLSGVEEAHQTMRRLGDPQNIQRVLDNPGIAEMRSDPAIATAIDEIRNDPALNQWIRQGRPVDPQLVRHLMDSPAVMRLVDHPDFIPQARQVIKDLAQTGSRKDLRE
ncbi:CvpA family protein [Stieleria maiorica]|uniref:CvpA family protein n=1 Tax=Stieleria maiorica TaxID=2795974 RepID=UPI00142F388B|nr:CvpA family protein [Stieleria maiorica]